MKEITLTDNDFQEILHPGANSKCVVIERPFCRMQMHSEKVDSQLLFVQSQTMTQQTVRISMSSDYFSGYIGISFILEGKKNDYLQGWDTPLRTSKNQLMLCYVPVMKGYSEFFAHRNTATSGFYLNAAMFQQLLKEDPRPHVQALFAPIYKSQDRPFTLFSSISAEMCFLLKELQNQRQIGFFNGFSRRAKMYDLLQLTVEQIIHEHCPEIRMLKLRTSDILKLEQVKTILNNDIQNPPSLSQIGKIVALNECKLKRGFKYINQKTIFQHLFEQRMKHAAYLLNHTTLAIVEISHLVGYGNHGHFSAAFREHFKQTPSAFRKETSEPIEYSNKE